MSDVAIGKKAPAFKLPDADGNAVDIKDYNGKKIILYFYPKDMTSGCTQEACDFQEAFPKFDKIKAVVLGISKDSVQSHKKFAEKFGLKFRLLSDEKSDVCERYGVWKEKSMYGRKYMGIERTTFIIDEDGKIQKIFPRVKVKGHVEEILKELEG
ncbi:MAG: thioredoxin-dependent thiol peroxidase [Melioribacteraceae bacterium]|nr:thioredoxin-dependent thiol peroxidase [Melioribacteraceae bacterium]